MPDENEVGDAIEAAERQQHALPPAKSHLKEWAAVLTAGAALVAAVSAFVKTFDHSVTEASYNTLSESIVKLSDQEQASQRDIASIRGYLEGIARAPLPVSSGVAVVDAGAPAGRRVDAGPAITFSVISTSSPPVVHPPSAPVKPPSFADVKSAK